MRGGVEREGRGEMGGKRRGVAGKERGGDTVWTVLPQIGSHCYVISLQDSFKFSPQMGPLVLMVQKMVVQNVLPFMTMFVCFFLMTFTWLWGIYMCPPHKPLPYHTRLQRWIAVSVGMCLWLRLRRVYFAAAVAVTVAVRLRSRLGWR